MNHISICYILVCHIPIVTGQQLDTSSLRQRFNFLANDILGVSKFQNYLDTLTYNPTAQSDEEIRQSLKNDLATKINRRVAAVTALRDKVQETYINYGGSSAFGDCCQCCSSNNPYGRLKFKSEVDFDKMCHTGQGTSGSSAKKYPTNALLEVMKTNFNDNPNLKWQYFGGEDGIMTIYPGNKACDEKFDPRFRSWYSNTAFPSPKDVVLVIDRSGSMATTFHGDRQLMEIAKEAANTVLDTLNPDDRVGVVFFSNEAETLSSGCYSSQLAEATPENKNTLKSYVNRQTGNGGTWYSRAFRKAFEFFGPTWSRPQFDERARIKVILFLTDGKPSETNDNTYLDEIKTSNAAVRNEVVILTFGFGDGIGEDGSAKLRNIAHQNSSDPSAGEIKPGRFLYVRDPNELRSSMARYYDFFSNDQTDITTVAVPYVDAFGLGFITSICLPVHTDGVFRGVTCIDITVADLFTDATYFSQNKDSYAFITDGKGRLLVHPLLPRPSDIYEEPVLLHVLDIETEPEMRDVLTEMLAGTQGSRPIRSRRVLSRGDSAHDGVDTYKLESTYLWDSLGLSDLQLCVVLATRDQMTSLVADRPVTAFPYHRLDLTSPTGQCRYINRVAVTDTSTIKLAPFAFQSPESYLEQEETVEIIDIYDTFFTGAGDASFKAGVKDAVASSAMFDQVIDREQTAWQYSVWRYLALREGVLRLFPGAKLTKEYDPTIRPWYKRAVSQSDSITFSKPYVDAFGAGIIVTLSKALYEAKSGGGHTVTDPVAGVMGMDFTLDLFNSILTETVAECSNKHCIVMDSAGFIISHPDFVNVNEGDFGTIENIHISQKEKAIASDLVAGSFLLEDQCINFKELQVQSFWRGTQTTFSSSAFELIKLRGTNIFLIVKDSTLGQNGDCPCAVDKGVNIPQCNGSSVCRCPCFSRDGVQYDPCDVTFTFDAEIGSKPPCSPRAPDIDLASVAEEEEASVENMPYCYDVKTVCPSRDSQSNCSATAGCRWCPSECTVRTNDGCAKQKKSISLVIIIVPVLVVIAIVAIVLIIWWCRCRNPSSSSSQQPFPHGDRPPPTAPGYEMGQKPQPSFGSAVQNPNV